MMVQEAKPVTAAIREPEAAASLRREGNTRLEEKVVIREIPLQDTATLETELSTLQRRQLREQTYTDTQSTYLLVYAPGRRNALTLSLAEQLHRKFRTTRRR